MLTDAYGLDLTTTSQAARDAYVAGTDLFLAAQPGAEDAFARAVAEDPGFALGHIAQARSHHMLGQGAQMRTALALARETTEGATAREQAHIHILTLAMTGQGPAALAALKEHAKTYPRDVLAMQPAMGVFGLIGFSGRPGREEEQLAFTTSLAPAYGQDWWFLGSHAFAQMEFGDLEGAEQSITRSMEQRPDSANGAHYLSHLYYEMGETARGLRYLTDWMPGYDRRGLMHTHISWHIALWALAEGDVDRMWQIVDADIAPDATWGPSINVVTDMAAILHRAELAGVTVAPERWTSLSTYAAKTFPKPGIAFVDVHAALAHAMAGDSQALAHVIEGARGPAADVVRHLAEGFGAIARGDWAKAEAALAPSVTSHAQIGGSRAQRDLVEYTYANVLMRLGRTSEAAHRLHSVRGRTALGAAPVH